MLPYGTIHDTARCFVSLQRKTEGGGKTSGALFPPFLITQKVYKVGGRMF